jgi:CPA1 family monovalent cation:H+ antiporter
MLGLHERMSTPEGKKETFKEVNQRRKSVSERDLDMFARRVTQMLADIDYFLREPLGWREGTAVVWAGMRGAVTVAAAQTLSEDTPQRSVLVLIAFGVAAMSLVVQGGTIGPLLRLIEPKVDQAALDEQTSAERSRIMELMRNTADAIPEPSREPSPEGFTLAKGHRLAVIDAQRAALLDARDNGTFDADVLAYALANLDASQIAIEMRGGPAG